MDADNSLTGQADDQPSGQVEARTPKDPTPTDRYDLVVLGGGRAGVWAAAEGRRLGRRVALVARPDADDASPAEVWAVEEALWQAARAVHRSACGGQFGGRPSEVRDVDFARVMAWVGEVRAKATQERRLQQLVQDGIDVYLGQPVFIRRDALEVDGRPLKFRRAILAAESRPVAADSGGANRADCLTPERLPKLRELPRRLAVIGTGPRECRWAQTFRRFGSDVHLIGQAGTILPEEDPEAAATVRRQLEEEAVRLHLGCNCLSIEKTGNKHAVIIEKDGRKEKLFLDQTLVDRVREPDIAGLGLHAAGVAFSERGVLVGVDLRTTNRRIFAAGDVCGRRFAGPEVAEATGRLSVQNALGRRRRTLDQLIIPHHISTDPEIVRVGLTPAEAARRQVVIDTYRAELSEVDQDAPDPQGNGFAVVRVRRATGRVLGACVVAENAKELIAPLVLLMSGKRTLADLAEVIPCRPSRCELLRLLAERYAAGRRPSRRAHFAETCRHGWRGLRLGAIHTEGEF